MAPVNLYAPATQLVALAVRELVFNNVTGTVLDTETRGAVPQGSGSDGSGDGFNPPALIWIGFLFTIGIPLCVAGLRGWRLTIGAALGLSAAVGAWAAFINSSNEIGVSDMLLQIIVLAFFAVTFALGFFEFARLGGLAFLALAGGASVGIRVVLFRAQLLVPIYFVNWIVVAFFAVASGFLMVFRQRAAIASSSAACGTFLVAVAGDLIVEQQSLGGFSRGLRFLFDRNKSHAADILFKGFTPSLTLIIVMGSSLGLIPLLACAQHRVWKHPFSRKPEDGVDLTSLLYFQENAGQSPPKENSLNRFSV